MMKMRSLESLRSLEMTFKCFLSWALVPAASFFLVSCAEEVKTKSPPSISSSGDPTHELLQVELADGYVSGCLYEKPHYQMTFDKFKLKHYKRVKKKSSHHEQENFSQEISEKPNKKESALNKIPLGQNHWIESPEVDFDPQEGTFYFPLGLKVGSKDDSLVRAEKGMWWTKENIIYLEGHVAFTNDAWDITFESLILNTEELSGLGQSPRLVINNPSGVLGLGRGSKLPSILRAKSLILHPKTLTHFAESFDSKKTFEAEGGQAKWGDFSLFRFPYKVTDKIDSPFAGARAGRNSRHGVFLHSKFRLLHDTFRVGDGFLKARIFARENWYEKRGFGHGVQGKYNLKIGSATAQGRLNFLAIDDKDRDRKQTAFTKNTRFFGHWIHRGKAADGWQWNWEVSRESDAEVRDQFDRKLLRREKPYQNRLFLAKRDGSQRMSLLLQARSEEFIQEVDYLPRIQWDWLRHPISKDLIFDGHFQFANARLNQAEAEHRDAPSIRAARADFSGQLSYPFQKRDYIVEPYTLGSLTWYSRQPQKSRDVTRNQGGLGLVFASRWHKGIYRLLPRIDARRAFKTSERIDNIPQIDSIDTRTARETIEMSWRHLVRGSISGNKRDRWDLDVHVTAFPNRHRDNEGDRWSPASTRLNIIPHRRFEFFSDSEFDIRRRKFKEFSGGILINPESRTDIGTSSSGREIFSGNTSRQSRGHHQNFEWAFSLENRYIDDEPSRVTGQIDILPRDKWKVSYAQEWLFDGSPDVSIHRLQVNQDLHDWTISFDWEIDSEDRSQSFSFNMSPHGWGKF